MNRVGETVGARYDLARFLARQDGYALQEIRATVGDPDDANRWRHYLGRADDVLGFLSARPTAAETGVEEFSLSARVWRRESTQEWVLEIEGEIGDTWLNSRHTEPLSRAPEDVPGLPSLYAAEAELASLRERVAELEAGLRDFADVAAEWDGEPDSLSVELAAYNPPRIAPNLCVATFRRARALLTPPQETSQS